MAFYAAAHYAWAVPEQKHAERLARRMGELSMEHRRAGGRSELTRSAAPGRLGGLADFTRWLRLIDRLQDAIEQANLRYRASNVALLALALAAGGYLLAGLFQVPLALLRLLAGVVAGALPILYILWKRRRRLRAFEAALPDAIDLFGRALRAGHNILGGLEVIASETYDPVRMEFRKVMDEVALGSQTDLALRNLARRMPLVDLHFFVTGVILQRQTGANIVGVLESLSGVIRERLTMAARLKAHTAQQRLSAVVMILAPLVTGLAFYLIKPDHVRVLWTDPVGALFFTYAICSEIVGALVLWRIASVRF